MKPNGTKGSTSYLLENQYANIEPNGRSTGDGELLIAIVPQSAIELDWKR